MDIEPLCARTGETVVLETDFCTDVDDVAALSLLCGEEKRHPGAFRLGGGNYHAPAQRALLFRLGQNLYLYLE